MYVNQIGYAGCHGVTDLLPKGTQQQSERVTETCPDPPGASPAEGTAAEPRPNRDVTEWSPDSRDAVDWGQMTQQWLQNISKLYPRVDVTVADLEDEEALRNLAASLGAGAHLVVSREFLARMASGESAFFKGKEFLEQALGYLRRNGDAQNGVGIYVEEDAMQFWFAKPKEDEKNPFHFPEDTGYKTLFETMKRLQKEAEEREKKFQVRINSAIYQSPADCFSRLARANTVSGVREVISTAEQKIYTLRIALSLGPKDERAKARAAIAALEKVVIRSSGKIKDLNEEDDLRRRRKKAEQEQRVRKAEQIKYELKQKQASRRSREHAQITEGQPWFYYQQELMRKKQIMPRPEEMGDLAVELAGMDSMAGMIDAVMGGEVSAPEFSAADVTVSPSVEISF